MIFRAYKLKQGGCSSEQSLRRAYKYDEHFKYDNCSSWVHKQLKESVREAVLSFGKKVKINKSLYELTRTSIYQRGSGNRVVIEWVVNFFVVEVTAIIIDSRYFVVYVDNGSGARWLGNTGSGMRGWIMRCRWWWAGRTFRVTAVVGIVKSHVLHSMTR